MSRSRHSRPERTSDALSRVQQAAISVADAFTRFERDFARLQRAMLEAREEGADDGHIAGSINLAGRGRVDRQDALRQVVDRLARQGGADCAS